MLDLKTKGNCDGLQYHILAHSELSGRTDRTASGKPFIYDPSSKVEIQKVLDNAEIIIGQNLKFDLQWGVCCGFKFNSARVYDTMLVEYILSRGVKRPLDLDSIARRYGHEGKDGGPQEYLDKGVSFENIPLDIVVPYGIQDLVQTGLVCASQCAILGVEPDALAA